LPPPLPSSSLPPDGWEIRISLLSSTVSSLLTVLHALRHFQIAQGSRL
jgi:hypothetical protein